MDTKVVDLVDKLLDTIRFEIARMKEMGEDTSILESQLRDFRKEQRDLPDWIMNNDEPAVKLFLTKLLQFSKSVHTYYIDVKSGKHLVDLMHEEATKELAEERKQTNQEVTNAIDLMTDDDSLLVSSDSLDVGKSTDGSAAESGESDEGVMDTSVDVGEGVKEIEKMIEAEKRLLEAKRKKGIDTLDEEFIVTQQESLLISMKEALLEGNYEEAQRLKEKIEELGRRIK